MRTGHYFDRQRLAAITLGLLALLTNYLAYYLWHNQAFWWGNIFLFISAGALGPLLGILTCAIGIFPLAFSTNLPFIAPRLLILTVVFGLVTQRWRRLPSFLSVALLWLVVFAPLAIFVGWNYLSNFDATISSLLFTGITEVACAMIAGLVLLNRNIWGELTGKPRPLDLPLLTTHLFLLGELIAFATVIVILTGAGDDRFTHLSLEQAGGITAVVVFLVSLAVVVGRWVSKYFNNNAQELLGQALLGSNRSMSFSGLSSDYWRRHQSLSHDQPLVYDDQVASTDEPTSRQAALCAITADGTISFVNRRFCSLTMVKDQEPVGKQIALVGLPTALVNCLDELRQHNYEQGPHSLEVKLEQLPDKLKYLRFSAELVQNSDYTSLACGPNGIVVTVTDVTNRRYIKSNVMKNHRKQTLGNIVDNLAQRCNQMLVTINQQAATIKGSCKADSAATAINELLSTTGRFSRTVEQLLEYCSCETHSYGICDLNKLLQDYQQLLSDFIGDSITLKVECAQSPIRVECNQQLLLQAMINVILNSYEAISSGAGEVTINLAVEELGQDASTLIPGGRAGHFARVRIQDDGPGMNPEILSRSCDSLYSTKDSPEHLGLGLPITYAIVRGYDGFLTIESYPEQGTSVTIYLPLHQ